MNNNKYFIWKYILYLFMLIAISAIAETTPQYFSDLQSSQQTSSPYIKWTNFGPGMSGYCDELFVHPTDPNSLYMNLDMGNSYYTHDAAQSWISMQEWDSDGEGGRPVWMDFSHQDPDFGFALDEKGKLKKTTDRGKTWKQVNDFSKKHSVITVDPNNDNNWYIGAGQFWRVKSIHRSLDDIYGTQYRNTLYGYIYVSKDKGETWTKVSKDFNENLDVAKIFVDPTNSDIVFIYTNYGFYKSVDGGFNWEKKGNGLPYNQPRDGDWYYNKTTGEYNLYLLEQTHYEDDDNNGIKTTGGIYKSIDHGETWKSITGNLAIDMNKISLSNAKDKYYRAIAYWLGISQSEAESKFNKLPSSTYTVFNRVVASKIDPDVVFLSHNIKHDYSWGPGAIWRTTDAGDSWIIVGRHGQYWINKEDKDYWESRNNPQGMNMTYAHLDHEMRDYDMTPGTRMMTTTSNGDLYIVHEQQILRSVDNGNNWKQVDDDEVSPNSGKWVGRGGSNLPGENLTLETGMSRYLFASGEHGLWISADGGDKIQKGRVAVEQLSGQSIKPYDATSITAAAVHPNDTNKIYMLMFRQSERGKVRRTIDGGKTWENISYPLKSSTDISPEANKIMQKDLIFNPDDPNIMYFTVPYARWVSYVSTLLERNGPSDFNGFGVYRSKDEGYNWELINTGLPDGGSIFRISMDPNNSSILYATANKVNMSGATTKNGGLYKTINGGNNWTQMTIPAAIEGVNHVSITKNGIIYIAAGDYEASLEGGGVWKSIDNGNTWEKIFFMPHVVEVYQSKANSNMLVVNVGRAKKISNRNPGVYFSKDQGKNWTKANYQLGQPSRIRTVKPDPKDENVMWAALKGSGWYRAQITDKKVRAMATNLFLYEGETVQLDASQSFGNNITFKWYSSPELQLSANNIAKPMLSAGFVNKDTTFKIELVVSNSIDSDTLEVLVTVRNKIDGINKLPTAKFSSLATEIETGQEIKMTIDYEVFAEQQISVVLSTPEGTYIDNTKVIVQAGNGSVNLSLSPAEALAVANGYNIYCSIRPVNGGESTNITKDEKTFNVVEENTTNINSIDKGKISVYPSIVTDFLIVKNTQNKNLLLLDISGKTVTNLKNGHNNISHIPAGIYFIKTDNNSASLKKIIIQ